MDCGGKISFFLVSKVTKKDFFALLFQ
jgi:hypothetical protein